MAYCQCRVYLILMGLICFALSARAAEKAAFVMSVAEFRQLSPNDQKTLLASAFEHRLDHGKNIYYEIQVRLANHEYRNAHVGKQLVALNGRNYHHWQLGSSYRTDTEMGGPNVAKPDEFVASGFDTDAGVGKSTTRFDGHDQAFGRIDVIHNPVTQSDRYAYWLDGKHVPMGEYLFRYLADHQDSYMIETPADQETVRLIVPWTPIHSDKPLGTREFTLDSQKGFLPIRGKARWEEKSSNGETNWRTEEFEVEASQLVGDVWMPTKLKELISGSPLGADKITVWETNVTKIELGKVVPKDLEITFSPGTRVVDAIKGVTYIVGENDEPTNVQSVVGVRPGTTPPKTSKTNVIHMLIGAALLVAVAISLLWRLLRKNRAKSVD